MYVQKNEKRLSEDVPVEFQAIHVYFKVNADVSEDKKEELIKMAQKYSPVFNSITKPISVSVELDKTGIRLPKPAAA